MASSLLIVNLDIILLYPLQCVCVGTVRACMAALAVLELKLRPLNTACTAYCTERAGCACLLMSFRCKFSWLLW